MFQAHIPDTICAVHFYCGVEDVWWIKSDIANILYSSSHHMSWKIQCHKYIKKKNTLSFSHDGLIISFKVTFGEKLLMPNTAMLQATGASIPLHSVSPPHRLLLMYFSSQQLGRELPVDTSPLVQQRTAYTHYCLYLCVWLCAHFCV